MNRYDFTYFESLLGEASDDFIRALVDAANRIKNAARVKELEAMIVANDWDEIPGFLGIDPAAFMTLDDLVSSLYLDSGALELRYQQSSVNRQKDEVRAEIKKAEAEEAPETPQEAAAGPSPGSAPTDPFQTFPGGTGGAQGPGGAWSGGTGGGGRFAGMGTGGGTPGASPFNSVHVQFDIRNPRAEAYLREHSGRLIREIADDQREMIRTVLERGMEMGRNPRDLAIDLVGRLDKVSGRRNGGMIGLTTAQSQWVQNARYELENGHYSEFLSRRLRNRTFDRTIAKARNRGETLTQEQIDKIINLYQSRMLQMRAETIARTEMLRSQNAARYEAALQTMEANGVEPQLLTRQWKSTPDLRTRDTHRAMHNQTVYGVDELFITPDDHAMLYPGDTDNGAPASEVINCRCTVVHKVDYKEMARRNGWIK